MPYGTPGVGCHDGAALAFNAAINGEHIQRLTHHLGLGGFLWKRGAERRFFLV